MSSLLRMELQALAASLFFMASIPEAFAEPLPPAYLQTTAGPAITHHNTALMEFYIARYQQAVMHPWQPIPTDSVLKKGMRSPSIALLRARLIATDDLRPVENTTNDTENNTTEPMVIHSNALADTMDLFDDTLQLAVQNYQQRMGLKPDGVVGAETLRELNIPPEARLQQIIINLKRWNALTPQLSQRFILVNIPDYRLYAYEDGKKIFDMKAIVGKPTRKTPEITSRITRVILNPSWNVPDLIARKDIVPKVLADPDYLDEMHIRIYEGPEKNAPEISANEIDWESLAESAESDEDSISSVKHFPWFLRQAPGNDNALGRVKFEFQNADSIYLHDTPTKNLFAEDQRLFSSGCIRLEHPFALVNYLMQQDPTWDDNKMQNLLDTERTIYIRTPKPTPIFITYLTAWVDENGALNFRDDVYHEDNPEQPVQPLASSD